MKAFLLFVFRKMSVDFSHAFRVHAGNPKKPIAGDILSIHESPCIVRNGDHTLEEWQEGQALGRSEFPHETSWFISTGVLP